MTHHIAQKPTAPALASTRTQAIFEDPAWDERFEAVIQLTRRSALVGRLCSEELRAKKIRERIKDVHGEDVSTKRGAARTVDSEAFLATRQERVEAGFLLALHFGSSARTADGRLDQSRALADHINQARFVDKLISVYNRYLKECADRGDAPRVSFEDYVLVLDGMQTEEVMINGCKDCGSLWPWRLSGDTQQMASTCPSCFTLEMDMTAAKADIAGRLANREDGYKRYSCAV